MKNRLDIASTPSVVTIAANVLLTAMLLLPVSSMAEDAETNKSDDAAETQEEQQSTTEESNDKNVSSEPKEKAEKGRKLQVRSNFKPSEEITADNSVPYPVDI